jgi:hypothetical protein
MDPLTLIGAIPTAVSTINSLKSLFQGPYNPPKQYQENSREVFKKGGKIRGNNKYSAPTHEQGGQLVNNEGIPDPNGNNEIETNESKYTYTRLNKKNPTYIFTPEDTEKVNMLTKKYSKANTDNLQKNALELSIQRIEKDNEMKKKQEGQMKATKFSKGGVIKKYNAGGFVSSDPLQGLFSLSPKNYSLASDAPMQKIPQLPFQEVKSDPRIKPINQIIQPLDTGLEKRFVSEAKLRTPPVPSTIESKTPESTSNPLKTLDTLRNLSLAGSSLGMLKSADREDPIMTDYGPARKELNKLNSNLDPMRQQMSQSSNQLRNVNRNSSGSYNSFANREAQRVGNLQQGLAGITMQEQQLSNNIASQKAQFEAGVGQDNKQTLQQNRMNNQQNEGATDMNNERQLQTVISDLDRRSRRENNKNITDATREETIALLSTMYDDFDPSTPFNDALIKRGMGQPLTAEEKETLKNGDPINFRIQ